MWMCTNEQTASKPSQVALDKLISVWFIQQGCVKHRVFRKQKFWNCLLWSAVCAGGGTKFTGSLSEQLRGTNLSLWQTSSEGINDDPREPRGVQDDLSSGDIMRGMVWRIVVKQRWRGEYGKLHEWNMFSAVGKSTTLSYLHYFLKITIYRPKSK